MACFITRVTVWFYNYAGPKDNFALACSSLNTHPPLLGTSNKQKIHSLILGYDKNEEHKNNFLNKKAQLCHLIF